MRSGNSSCSPNSGNKIFKFWVFFVVFEVFYFFYFKFNYISKTTSRIIHASGALKQIRSRDASFSDDGIVINSNGKQVQPFEPTLLRTSTRDSRRVLNDPEKLEKRILADLNVYFDKAPDKMMHILQELKKMIVNKQKKGKKNKQGTYPSRTQVTHVIL